MVGLRAGNSTGELAIHFGAVDLERALVVTVKNASRGRLADAIDDAIESSLMTLGAMAPCVGTLDPLADQTFRARLLGYEGMMLVLECLSRAAAPIGVLDGYDAECLRRLVDSIHDRPIEIVIPESCASVRAFTQSVAMSALFVPDIEEEIVEEPPYEMLDSEPTFSEVLENVMADDAEAAAESVAQAVSEALAEIPAARVESTLPAPPQEEARIVEESPMPEPVRQQLDESIWRPWVKGLESARGPQTLAAFERVFTQSYMPLVNAIARGLAHPDARTRAEDFRQSFAHAYENALPMFPLTSKRPKMVFDAHDVAGRIARQHGARTTHLLLVPNMRWDVGMDVKETLTASLAGKGSIVSEGALFSALPSTTWRQLEGIARGLEALRNPAEPQSEDPVRGRTSEIVRRVRAGARDVFKLDWVDAAVRASTGSLVHDLPGIAGECADLVLKHALALPPRTLLFVFGDHGFSIDHAGLASWGGASPEEVIVPCFGILVGELH